MPCRHYEVDLRKEDRHFINSKEHDNCVLCLVDDKGPMSQEETSKYFGLSKMRISQIEKRAMKKLKKRLSRFLN